jgi:hypothetical protein
MKAFLQKVLTAIIILTSQTVYAQYSDDEEWNRNHFSLGTGFLTNSQIMRMFDDGQIYTVTNGNLRTRSIRSKGAIMFSYRYALNKAWSIGTITVYDRSAGNLIDVNGTSIGNFTRGSFTGAIESEYIYSRGEYFKIYALAGLGLTYYESEYLVDEGMVKASYGENITTANFQFTPVGFRIGNTIAVSAEMGLGYKGVFNFGLSYLF